MPKNTAENEATAEQPAERDRHLSGLRTVLDVERDQMTARVKAWDARNPEIVAKLTPEQRGY
jgi:hypothetical protein